MVRFIIINYNIETKRLYKFTFQYGQIYYYVELTGKPIMDIIYIPIWLDLLFANNYKVIQTWHQFTFQYGQIYYHSAYVNEKDGVIIYIPIWLDLLSTVLCVAITFLLDLHSNMVRFIIWSNRKFGKRA